MDFACSVEYGVQGNPHAYMIASQDDQDACILKIEDTRMNFRSLCILYIGLPTIVRCFDSEDVRM